MRKILSLLILMALIPSVTSVMAQDNTPERPAFDALQVMVTDITSDLNKSDKHHFNQIYGSYSVINMVQSVQTRMDETVNECAKKHSEMATPLKTRFQSWNEAINPVMQESKAKVDNMIVVQEYTDQKQLKSLLTAIDDVRVETNGLNNATPATTQEACEVLLSSMNDSQRGMTALLRRTLASYPMPQDGASVEKK